jgi:uncharacterized protein DUF3999
MYRSSVCAQSVLVLAAIVLVFGAHGQSTLSPERFAVGWPLEVPADAEIVDVPLTLDVYRHAASDDQIAVLDAAGRPMSFYRVVQSTGEIEQGVVLDASPVYVSDPPGSAAGVSVDSAGGRTNVTVTAVPPGSERTAISGFIVDARALSSAPIALDLEWRDRSEPFLLNVSIEQSTTLTDWRAVGRGSVATLAIGGSRLRHTRVPVRAAAGGYYRISPAQTVPDWYLERVTLVLAMESQPPSESLSLAPLERVAPRIAAAESDNALYFDAGGPVPVSSVALVFGDRPGWARARIASAASLDGPWSLATGETLFYALDYEGEPFASEPTIVRRQATRYWRVTATEPLDAERVALRLEYPSEVIRVSVDGSAPYQLVAGTAAQEAGPDPTFAAVWRELPPGSAPARATIGQLRELGGPAALEAPFHVPWSLALLWSVLGVGVLAVSWMAVRLAREFREPPS